LLDEQQPECVELGEVTDVRPPVGGVGIHLQQETVAEALPHGRHGLQIETRLDLQLHPAVPLLDVCRHDIEELRNRIGDADRNPGGDRVPHASEELAERHARRAELGVEDRHLEGRLRHAVALHRLEERSHIRSADLGAAGETRDQVLADRQPGAVDEL